MGSRFRSIVTVVAKEVRRGRRVVLRSFATEPDAVRYVQAVQRSSEPAFLDPRETYDFEIVPSLLDEGVEYVSGAGSEGD